MHVVELLELIKNKDKGNNKRIFERKNNIMCTNKTLYQPGDSPLKVSRSRKRKRALSFQQISFMTDCLRMLANRLGMPIVLVSEMLNSKSVYRYFYQLVTEQPELSKVQVTNRLQKAISEA